MVVPISVGSPTSDDPEESELYAALENASLVNADEPATDLW